jgi:hypothetical protein
VRSVCHQRCLIYFAAFSYSSSLQQKYVCPMGAGIPTSFGTRAASAELSKPSFSNLFRGILFLCLTPAQRLGFSRTAPFQWCLSPMYSLADAAYRPRNAEPALHHFLPASLASLAESPSTSSGWASCLRYQILLLLSRHRAFHGRSQSRHIASPNHPAACGT